MIARHVYLQFFHNCKCLCWRVLTGRHKTITLSFLIAGHTKFAPDWCFGLAKQRLRKTKVGCLSDIASAIEQSATSNKTQLMGTIGLDGISVCSSYRVLTSIPNGTILTTGEYQIP